MEDRADCSADCGREGTIPAGGEIFCEECTEQEQRRVLSEMRAIMAR